MPTIVICPSCQSKGTIPDGVTVSRIRCPKCKESFAVGGASPGSVRETASALKTPVLPVFDDLESLQPDAPVMSSGIRRSPAAEFFRAVSAHLRDTGW